MSFIDRLFAASAIRIRDGRAACVKGKLAAGVVRDISSVAAEAGVAKGEIWIDPVGKVNFSREIPEEIHQQIRNLIVAP